MTQWQPIETAPKDGTSFLGWQDGFLPEHQIWDPQIGWMTFHGAYYRDPTHWMPLPAPPETKE